MHLIQALLILHLCLLVIALVMITLSRVHSRSQKTKQVLLSVGLPILGPLFTLGAQIAIRTQGRPPRPDHDFKDNWWRWF